MPAAKGIGDDIKTRAAAFVDRSIEGLQDILATGYGQHSALLDLNTLVGDIPDPELRKQFYAQIKLAASGLSEMNQRAFFDGMMLIYARAKDYAAADDVRWRWKEWEDSLEADKQATREMPAVSKKG